MYSDPTRIRSHTIKVRLSDRENDLIDALVNYTGEQKAVLIREMVLEAAASALGLQSAPVGAGVEVPLGARLEALNGR